MTLILGFIDTRDAAKPHLQSDCDISASCCPFPAEPCRLCSFIQTHPFRMSVLFLLEMRNMYQMQKDVSFITCCSCLSVSQLKTDKQIVQSILNHWHCHHRRSMLALQEMTNEKLEMKILFFYKCQVQKRVFPFADLCGLGKRNERLHQSYVC